MGFIDILPSSIRIALLYVGSSKIAKKDGKSNKEKLQLILILYLSHKNTILKQKNIK